MREFAESLYKSRQWRKTREAYLASVGGLCEDCLKRGIYKPAEIVHHIEHVEPWNIDNPEVTLSWKNLCGLCRDCHAKAHKEIYKPKTKKRFTISCGGTVKISEEQ